ncbi:MAG: dihydroorotate dehydrogenase electron transfer subunit [Candidatus Omnitrophica bacterium]|nr:dihydroorotate dehydrogenase electron transfer subunit [Candidatus Omnitrophota bacterium]
MKIQHQLKIISNKKITDKLYHLVLEHGKLAAQVKPGQFVEVRIQESLEPFFRRPFSVFRSQKAVEIFYEVRGKGTGILSSQVKGAMLDVMGPLGTAFTLPAKKIKQVVMIGGGIGVAPFMALSDALKNRGHDLLLLYGGRSKEFTFNMAEFKKNGCKVFISTDDGSVGVKGRVSELFDKIEINPDTTMLYTCGPRPMMASVQKFAQEHGLKGQCSCEEVMACGVGVCLGCVVKTTAGYKTVCHDGPVFDLHEIVW